MIRSREAWVNISAQRAVVVEPDGRKFLVEVESNGTVKGPFEPGGLHIGMWLQPADCRILNRDTGEYPYLPVQAALLRKYWLSRIIFRLEVAIDGSNGDDLRALACRELSGLVDAATPEVVEYFRQILLCTPWPEGSSTRDIEFAGRAGEIFSEAVAKHGHAPS